VPTDYFSSLKNYVMKPVSGKIDRKCLPTCLAY
jgi:hypothetical protein